MKTTFFIVLFLIANPFIVFSSPIDDINGFWISEENKPMRNTKEIIEIKDNTIKVGNRKPQSAIITVEKGEIIVIPDEYNIFGNGLFDKYTFINSDKVIREFPTFGGKRKQLIYNRITQEEAQKYLATPPKRKKLAPTDDPKF